MPLADDLDESLHTLDALCASLAVATSTAGVHDLATAFEVALRPVRAARAYLVADSPTVNGNGQVRADHGDTARAAALLVAPKTGSQRGKVLDALYRARIDGDELEGLTDVQLATRTGLVANTVRPRRGELVEGGFVTDSGQRVLHGGRRHVVWQITEKALAHYGQSAPAQ